MASSTPRPYAPFTSRYGSLGENGEWREAIESYCEDRLEESFALAQALGAGFGGGALRWYRMIEGEALTRRTAKVESLEPWLSLEGNASEGDVDHETIREACREVAGRLDWRYQMPVRVTVLLTEVDARWHGARYGYCVDKVPYDKICVPARAAHDPRELGRVVAHEFTHAITLNLTEKRIPHWLDEGLAMLMENAAPVPPREWLDPEPLNAAFEADRRDEAGLARSHDAYLQSHAIVRYLHRRKNDAGLARLLRAFTNNGFWDEIKINLLGEPSAEEALREVYGFGQRELFEAARP